MRDEVEAAYFALLRAREEAADLRRYEEYLREELRRIRRFGSEGAALAESAPPRLQRRVRHTDDPVEQALKARVETLEDELKRLPARIESADEFVVACEAHHDRLRAG